MRGRKSCAILSRENGTGIRLDGWFATMARLCSEDERGALDRCEVDFAGQIGSDIMAALVSGVN